ncbi:DUF4179 domain-containing protein [Paenibacillus sp. URB8-2]|uniref:DUF4179 domain-containing protein n=1 Tax=Paenibacillus sp. URB8-2 TaxID=2741301 RepID=UPI0015BF0CAB|nr:DUF4179 domain-containing protein [Paenibacillus sp. URB8-2]BCG61534.1 hypothetical protein PUR_49590 [Paenibacillus sp. URB8-2]
MRNMPIAEDKEIMRLKQQIRETPVTVDLVERTLQNYDAIKESGSHKKSGRRRRSVWVIASATMALVLVFGSGFVSPVMADSLKQIPGMDSIFRLAGDLGLRTADEKGMLTALNMETTHEGVTLEIPVIMFDGTRVSVGIERKEFGDKALPYSVQEQIKNVHLSIDGKDINSFAPANTSNTIGPYIFPNENANSAILEFSDLRNQGGQAFPDEFELTMDITLTDVQEPFVIHIPVKKNTANNVVLTPSVQRTYGDISLSLEKVEFTPITTSITTRINFTGKSAKTFTQSPIGYDILDADGNKLKFITGNGWNATGGDVLVTDSRFEPFKSLPEFITIKPYIYLYQTNDPSQFQLDDKGNPKIEYLSDLEITIPVK